ncbi:MAG: hypothetical protein V3T30_02145 [Thermodesulfobacteriota bacterium]
MDDLNKFSAKWDGLLKFQTGVFLLLFSIYGLFFLVTLTLAYFTDITIDGVPIKAALSEPYVVLILVLTGIVMPFGLILFVAYRFIILSYRVEGSRLVISHPTFEQTVELTGLETIKAEPLAHVWLTWNNGVFSYGSGWSKQFNGKFAGHVTDRARAVVLRFSSGRAVVVSPAETEEFISAIKPASGL